MPDQNSLEIGMPNLIKRKKFKYLSKAKLTKNHENPQSSYTSHVLW